MPVVREKEGFNIVGGGESLDVQVHKLTPEHKTVHLRLKYPWEDEFYTEISPKGELYFEDHNIILGLSNAHVGSESAEIFWSAPKNYRVNRELKYLTPPS